jgi:hypothetical protein
MSVVLARFRLSPVNRGKWSFLIFETVRSVIINSFSMFTWQVRACREKQVGVDPLRSRP